MQKQIEGAPDPKAKPGTKGKKKTCDVYAAKNRCRLKLKDDMKKMHDGLQKLLKESEAVLVQHAQSLEYECYINTLKQRAVLVKSVLVSFSEEVLRCTTKIQATIHCQVSPTLQLKTEVMATVQFRCVSASRICWSALTQT